MDLRADELERAVRRLRGLVVETPLIGEPWLPDHRVPIGLRLKPEQLQPGGSIWFRGAAHALLRRLGATAAVRSVGPFPQVLAEVVAAGMQRIDVDACVVGAADVLQERLLRDAGARSVRFGAEVASTDRRVPCIVAGDDSARDQFTATAAVGAELADGLPAGCEVVVVSPAALAPPIRVGLVLGGSRVEVVGIDPDPARAAAVEQLRVAVQRGARLCSEPLGLAALDAVLTRDLGASPCVVLSC